jgi:hypothetical protein
LVGIIRNNSEMKLKVVLEKKWKYWFLWNATKKYECWRIRSFRIKKWC